VEKWAFSPFDPRRRVGIHAAHAWPAKACPASTLIGLYPLVRTSANLCNAYLRLFFSNFPPARHDSIHPLPSFGRGPSSPGRKIILAGEGESSIHLPTPSHLPLVGAAISKLCFVAARHQTPIPLTFLIHLPVGASANLCRPYLAHGKPPIPSIFADMQQIYS
jgi:hypothetical protein